MTRLEAFKGSLDKWTEALECTPDNYLSWWYNIGSQLCMLCKHFRFTYIHSMCFKKGDLNFPCPLSIDPANAKCAQEWQNIYKSCNNEKITFEIFMENAQKLHDRIETFYQEELKNDQTRSI